MSNGMRFLIEARFTNQSGTRRTTERYLINGVNQDLALHRSRHMAMSCLLLMGGYSSVAVRVVWVSGAASRVRTANKRTANPGRC